MERGETLGNLDTLAGSATLVSTIMSQLSLRIFTISGLVLAIAWTLSPLGGQAALRIVSLANVTSESDASFSYPKDNYNTWQPSGLFATADVVTEKGMAQALYISSLISSESVKQSSVDLWANVKIPYIEQLEQNASHSIDSQGWYVLTDASYHVASLIGIPVLNLPVDTQNSSLSLEASYWYLHCPVRSNDTYGGTPPTDDHPDGWVGNRGSSSVALWSNNTEYRGDTYGLNLPSNLSVRTIVFRAYTISSICRITTSYVEVGLDCESQTCRPVRTKRSSKQHRPADWTYLDVYYPSNTSLTIFANFAGWYTGLVPGHDMISTIVEGYLVDPGRPMKPRTNDSIVSLSEDLFSLRAAQILNTAWFATWIYQFNGVTEESQLGPGSTVTVIGTKTSAIEQITCSHLWFSVLLVASLVMLGAAIACAVLRMLRRGPEFELLFSTVVKEDPNVSLPLMSSTLDASERARRCKDVKIILGDVSGEDEVGHIALTNAGDGNVVRISKSRLYD